MNNDEAMTGAHGPLQSAPGRLDAERTDLDWAYQAGVVENVLDAVDRKVRLRKRRQRQRRAWAGGLAAAAIALVVGRAAFGPRDSVASLGTARSSALVVLPERQALSDGSTVELKDGAQIATEFTTEVRRVVLRSGEAHFQVTKDAQRPFVVRAGGVEVRAVGTAFSVQLGSTDMDVLVTEGRVAVDRSSSARPPVTNTAAGSLATLVTLDAGHRVVVELDSGTALIPRVVPVSPAEMVRRLAWRVPKLEFSATPLAEALPLINRHSRVQLELGDASLHTVELSGVLRADNLDTLFRLLATDYGIVAEGAGEDRIVLRKSPPPGGNAAR